MTITAGISKLDSDFPSVPENCQFRCCRGYLRKNRIIVSNIHLTPRISQSSIETADLVDCPNIHTSIPSFT